MFKDSRFYGDPSFSSPYEWINGCHRYMASKEITVNEEDIINYIQNDPDWLKESFKKNLHFEQYEEYKYKAFEKIKNELMQNKEELFIKSLKEQKIRFKDKFDLTYEFNYTNKKFSVFIPTNAWFYLREANKILSKYMHEVDVEKRKEDIKLFKESFKIS